MGLFWASWANIIDFMCLCMGLAGYLIFRSIYEKKRSDLNGSCFCVTIGVVCASRVLLLCTHGGLSMVLRTPLSQVERYHLPTLQLPLHI
jgi:hypothetical protein